MSPVLCALSYSYKECVEDALEQMDTISESFKERLEESAEQAYLDEHWMQQPIFTLSHYPSWDRGKQITQEKWTFHNLKSADKKKKTVLIVYRTSRRF